jgi:hypothetical protein
MSRNVMTPEEEADRRAEDARDSYFMEKSEFIHKAQTYVWNLWINRLGKNCIENGKSMESAIAATKAIVEEWTGHPCMVDFPSESSEEIPF